MPRRPCLRLGLILRCALLLRGSGQRKSRAGLRVPGMFLSCPGGSLGSEFYLAISQGFVFGVVCSVRPQDVPAVCLARCLRHWWPRGQFLGLWPLRRERLCVRVCVRLYSAASHACASASRPRTQQWSLLTSTVQIQNY